MLKIQRELNLRRFSSCGLVLNGVDLRRAGDVNPLICSLKCGESGHLRTPLAFLYRKVHVIGLVLSGLIVHCDHRRN